MKRAEITALSNLVRKAYDLVKLIRAVPTLPEPEEFNKLLLSDDQHCIWHLLEWDRSDVRRFADWLDKMGAHGDRMFEEAIARTTKE